MEFSETVRDLRLSLGETQAEFGKRIGRSLNYVSELERGVRQPSETVRSLVEFMIPDKGGSRLPRRQHEPTRENPNTPDSPPGQGNSPTASDYLLNDVIHRLSASALREYVETLGDAVAHGDVEALRVAGSMIPAITQARPEVFPKD